MFSYHVNQLDELVSIQFMGDLDIEVTEMMEEEIIPALESYTNIEFDFSGVPFVDSTGIGLLLNLINTLKNEELMMLKIINIQPLVREVFEMLQLDEILGNEVVAIHHP